MLLRQLIGTWFSDDSVEPGTSPRKRKEAGIGRFEAMVRNELRRQIEHHIGGDHQVVSYSTLISCNLVTLWRAESDSNLHLSRTSSVAVARSVS